MALSPNISDRQMGFALLRLMLGVNMLGRVLVRLPDVQQFAEGMARNFSETILPEPFVLVYAYVILLAEGVIGVLLILGWKTRWALAGMGLLLVSLAFGQILLQNYGTVANILIYAIAVYLLLTNTEYDHFGIDRGFSVDRK
ncbi:MAG: DoxX family membrane protein [Balneolales bacterium]|nr:DoxX family membrane protein [Balneolales bacterium]